MSLSATFPSVTRPCYRMTAGFAAVSALPQSWNARDSAVRARARGHKIMLRFRLALLIAALDLIGIQAQAEGKLPLPEEPHINEQLIAGAAGDKLRKTCPTLSARFFVVWQALRALEQYARDQGYTEEEVEAFLDDKDEKARVNAAADAYLAAAGAIPGNIESYCAAGRAEIAKDTLVGSLLRSSE